MAVWGDVIKIKYQTACRRLKKEDYIRDTRMTNRKSGNPVRATQLDPERKSMGFFAKLI